MKYHYYVFTQNYEDGNIFGGITSDNANYIINAYRNAVQLIYNYSKNFKQFWLVCERGTFKVNGNLAREMIDLAKQAGRHNIADRVIDNANSVICEGSGKVSFLMPLKAKHKSNI